MVAKMMSLLVQEPEVIDGFSGLRLELVVVCHEGSSAWKSLVGFQGFDRNATIPMIILAGVRLGKCDWERAWVIPPLSNFHSSFKERSEV